MTETVIKSRTPFERGQILDVTVTEGGRELCSGVFTLTEAQYGENRIKVMLAGGVGTPVEHRRGGHVREMFASMHALGKSEGAVLSVLHPFSFSFYRKFGYERVADHLTAEFPTRCLDFVPRQCRLVPYDETRLCDMISVYERFSRGRCLLLPRYDGRYYTGGGRQAYICYEGGEPAAYVVVSGSKTLDVNHYTDTVLTVHELAYTSPGSLEKIFSFLYMFEGEYDRIRMTDLSLCREADLMLRHYMHTEYRLVPDLAARVLDTEKLLDAHTYPRSDGTFTVRVEDGMESVAGLFRVTYGKDGHEVRRIPDGDADLTVDAGALTRILIGAPACDTRGLSYLPGVKVHKDCTDLIRAFPPRPCGIFEHF